MKLSMIVAAVWMTLTISGCGVSAFEGESGQQAPMDKEGGKTNGETGLTPQDDGVTDALGSGGETGTQGDGLATEGETGDSDTIETGGDEALIERCLKAWQGKHPFKKNPAFRVMQVGSVLPVSMALDLTQTSTPELILVKGTLGGGVLNEIKMQNQNGWYCLNVAIQPSFLTKIWLGCGSHLANASKASVATLKSIGVKRFNVLSMPIGFCPGEAMHFVTLDVELDD